MELNIFPGGEKYETILACSVDTDDLHNGIGLPYGTGVHPGGHHIGAPACHNNCGSDAYYRSCASHHSATGTYPAADSYRLAAGGWKTVLFLD